MPGLNYRKWTAALIPLSGVVLGAIDPAKNAAKKGQYCPKRNPANAGQSARNF
jgi:hypothetical protein